MSIPPSCPSPDFLLHVCESPAGPPPRRHSMYLFFYVVACADLTLWIYIGTGGVRDLGVRAHRGGENVEESMGEGSRPDSVSEWSVPSNNARMCKPLLRGRDSLRRLQCGTARLLFATAPRLLQKGMRQPLPGLVQPGGALYRLRGGGFDVRWLLAPTNV
eukprot:gene10108-biopygen21291